MGNSLIHIYSKNGSDPPQTPKLRFPGVSCIFFRNPIGPVFFCFEECGSERSKEISKGCGGELGQHRGFMMPKMRIDHFTNLEDHKNMGVVSCVKIGRHETMVFFNSRCHLNLENTSGTTFPSCYIYSEAGEPIVDVSRRLKLRTAHFYLPSPCRKVVVRLLAPSVADLAFPFPHLFFEQTIETSQ